MTSPLAIRGQISQAAVSPRKPLAESIHQALEPVPGDVFTPSEVPLENPARPPALRMTATREQLASQAFHKTLSALTAAGVPVHLLLLEPKPPEAQ